MVSARYGIAGCALLSTSVDHELSYEKQADSLFLHSWLQPIESSYVVTVQMAVYKIDSGEIVHDTTPIRFRVADGSLVEHVDLLDESVEDAASLAGEIAQRGGVFEEFLWPAMTPGFLHPLEHRNTRPVFLGWVNSMGVTRQDPVSVLLSGTFPTAEARYGLTLRKMRAYINQPENRKTRFLQSLIDFHRYIMKTQ